MATITIKRTSEFNNRLREYKIFIDGQQAGTIQNGETKDFETTNGPHIVTAKIDWCSSPDISIRVEDNEPKNLIVGGFKNAQWIMLTAIGLMILHFILSKFADFDYLIFLIVPLFLVIVYYMTMGRKNYLTLNELKGN